MKEILLPILLAIIISEAVALGSLIVGPDILFSGPKYNQQAHNDSDGSAKKENPSANDVSLAFRIGKFLDDHNGALNAIATVVIAALTIALVIFNRSLVRLVLRQTEDARQISGRQAEETKAQIAIAEKSAETANVSAQAAITSNHLTQSVFIATQRPWIKCEVSVMRPKAVSNHEVEFPSKAHRL
jgi:hypothetical protein